MKTTVVIGGNFAGITAALELKRKGKKDHQVIMVDKSPVFLFIPSLIWVPFGRRDIKDISLRKDNFRPIMSRIRGSIVTERKLFTLKKGVTGVDS